MFTEDQLRPISALQHLIFCPRQCALIHLERLWAENRWTIEGRHLHDKAHSDKGSIEQGVRIARGLQLHSLSLGLFGQADVVEFHVTPEKPDTHVVPIEYKRGKPKTDDSDRVQLCAQAMCLEEMLKTRIESGYLYYGKRKRRTAVEFDESLRTRTREFVNCLHELVANRQTPAAVRMPKCDQCSLLELCMPDSMRLKTGAAAFVQRQLESVLASDGPQTDDLDYVG